LKGGTSTQQHSNRSFWPRCLKRKEITKQKLKGVTSKQQHSLSTLQQKKEESKTKVILVQMTYKNI